MIIGLIGFKQVGKSTAAKYLEEKHGFVRHNFKDALVAEIKQNFPDLLEAILDDENRDANEYGHSYTESIDELFDYKPPLMRALLQNYGTEVRRRDDDDYWTKQWVNKYATTQGDVVADDVRFKNEAQTVKDMNGILVRLVRPDISTGGDHASETEQLSIEADYTIECNAGEHEKLYEELDKIVASLSST